MNVTEITTGLAKTSTPRPYFSVSVSAGFPSPADDHLDRNLDLNDHLIKHPAATFFVRVSGDSMLGAGINHNDILIVDRSLTPANNDIIVAVVNGDFTVKRIHKSKNKVTLLPENDQFTPIEIHESDSFEVWGVVTSVVHLLK